MRKGKSIIGLRVLTQAEGRDLGKVNDLIFDHETDELVALLISDKELFGLIDAKVVMFNQVQTIGADAVMVPSEAALINAHSDARIAAIMDRETALSGTRIATTDGRDIGNLADMYIDEETGRVLGYEVSTGFISDTMSGKRYMPAPQQMVIGEDVALVPPSVADDLEAQKQENPGGLKAAASTVTDKVSDVYGNIASASIEKQKEFIVGKVASRDVFLPAATTTTETTPVLPASEMTTGGMSTSSQALTTNASMDPGAREIMPGESIVMSPTETTSEMMTPATSLTTSTETSGQGEILVRQGETITREHADKAEQAGILHQLLLAAGGTVASDALAAGQEKLSGGAAAVQENAEEAAIGKTAGREVLNPDGSTIVAPGMTITRDMMETAKMHGKERELIAAAGLGTVSGAASTGTETVKEHAANAWDTLKQKAADLTGAAQDKKAEYAAQSEQNKINNALGRPTTRVILDTQDNVILNTGDLITHKAVDHARTAGVLDVLLDSVYTADPEITPEMLRASEPGTDALPSQAVPTGGPITATVAPDQPSQSTPSQGATG